MVLEFSIENYRSFKNEVKFSLLAESSQSKEDNTYEITYAHGGTERLLKSAVIYGANASGKSNVIRGIYRLVEFIKDSADQKVGDLIGNFETFLFDEDSTYKPVKFSLVFAVNRPEGLVKFKYFLEVDQHRIWREELEYYPRGQKNTLYVRQPDPIDDAVIERVKTSKSLGYKHYDLFRNQLLLSKFGREFPHELMTHVYLYFNSIQIWNATNRQRVELKRNELAEDLLKPENAHRLLRMNKLMRVADTRIENVAIKVYDESSFQFPEGMDEDIKSSILEDNKVRITAYHKVFKDQQFTRLYGLSLDQESEGTNVLFALGGIILKTLESGGTLFFDELDNSLHPKLSKFLIRLFNNPRTNEKNAQLIFATHEVTLLDKDVFRKDQIWFTQKNKFGVSELFSVKDFDGVREDTPFDKWYMSGKFGGTPKIKEVEFIFDHA